MADHNLLVGHTEAVRAALIDYASGPSEAESDADRPRLGANGHPERARDINP